MKILNKLFIPIILLTLAHSSLCGMKFMPLGQATFNLNKKIKEADTDQKKLNLLTIDEFKTLALRADRLSPADKNALPVLRFIKTEVVPLVKENTDIEELKTLFTKLTGNKLYPAMVKEINPSSELAKLEKTIVKPSKEIASLEIQKIKENVKAGKENLKQFYNFFGLKEDASDSEIDKAYRKLASMFHPDKPSGDQEIFKYINNVKEILKAYNAWKDEKTDENQKRILALKSNWQTIPKNINDKVKEYLSKAVIE